MSEGRTRSDCNTGAHEETAAGGVDRRPTLGAFICGLVSDLITRLNGSECDDLYRLVIGEVEGSLLRAVMRETGGNQVRAARILGINRGTLRKKLRAHGLLATAPQPTGGSAG